MSKADEMFKKLGYKKSEKPLEWKGEKIPMVKYHDDIHYKTINFDLQERLMHMSCISKDYKKVLEAINEKVKELGWDE